MRDSASNTCFFQAADALADAVDGAPLLVHFLDTLFYFVK